VNYEGLDRRKSERRPIVDSFSIFVMIPAKGSYQLRVHDLSEEGIGFDFDEEGENFQEFPIHVGDQIDLHLFLNQSLSIPLRVKVTAVRLEGRQRKIGAELMTQMSTGGQAIQIFLKLIDEFYKLGIRAS
jgi:hypothetical protein